jgi:prophage antirepressor-like protein
MTEVITDFHCKKCKKYYSSYQSLWIHNKNFHIKNNIHDNHNHESHNHNHTHNHDNHELVFIDKNIKKYQCNKCNKEFGKYQHRWRHEKNCIEKLHTINIDNKIENNDIKNNLEKIEKENIEIKNMLKKLLEKNCKIHHKTLQKINTDNINITSDNSIKFSNNELKSNDSKIIKSDNNNFQFDLNKNFLSFHDKPIKYFYYNDQVYFKGKDIASMLEYNDTTQAIRKNVDNDDIIIIGELFQNEDPQTVFINESGFYTIIFASKKAEAIKFRKWVTSEVLPSIRKTGSYNLIDNYIEEDLEKYHNKDCVYIIHIKDNIYKYGNTSHIFKRLQAHKTNLNYNKIIKIYEMNNMNNAIKLENKIKTLVKTLKINTVYNTHVEIFKVDNNNLQNLIKKIDDLSLKTSKLLKNNNDNNLELLKEKNRNLELQIELFKLSNNNSS